MNNKNIIIILRAGLIIKKNIKNNIVYYQKTYNKLIKYLFVYFL
jgi:hypothetical protein